MRNFEIPSDSLERSKCSERQREVSEEESEVRDSGGGGGDMSIEELERRVPQVFGELSPEALNYIQQLQSELSNVKEVSVLLCISCDFVTLLLLISHNLLFCCCGRS
jgi:hypothetical protein